MPSETTRRVLEGISQQRPVRLAFNESNVGFGPACNQGARLAQYNTLVFTQPDVTFMEDVTPKVVNLADGTLYGARLITFDTSWNRFGSTIISYLEGYFLACTRPTWTVIGGFDPQIVPADYEDVDLCYTATQKGVQLRELPIRASHVWGAHWNGNPGRQAITMRNRAYFAQKWGFA
jgi:GT2 family glycosyltransferase